MVNNDEIVNTLIYKGSETVEILDVTLGNIDKIKKRFEKLKQLIESELVQIIPSEWSGQHAEKVKELMQEYYDQVITAYIEYFDSYKENIEKKIKIQLGNIMGDDWQIKYCDMPKYNFAKNKIMQDIQRFKEAVEHYESIHSGVRNCYIFGESVSRMYGNEWFKRNIEKNLTHIRHHAHWYVNEVNNEVNKKYTKITEMMKNTSRIRIDLEGSKIKVKSLIGAYESHRSSGGTIDNFNSNLLKYNVKIQRIEAILNNKKISNKEKHDQLKIFLNEEFGIDIESELFENMIVPLNEKQKLKAMIDLYRLTKFHIDPSQEDIKKQIQQKLINNENWKTWKLKIELSAYLDRTLIFSHLTPEQFRLIAQGIVYELEKGKLHGEQTIDKILSEFPEKLKDSKDNEYPNPLYPLIKCLKEKGVTTITIHREQTDTNGASFFAISFKIGNEVIVSTAGSQGNAMDIFLARKDFTSNGAYSFKNDSNPHYQYTEMINQEMKAKYGIHTQITNTGHSLGGGSASYAQNTLGVAGQSVTFDAKGSHNEGNSVNYQGSLSIVQGATNGNTQYSAGSGGDVGHFVNNLENFKGDDNSFIVLNNDQENSINIEEVETIKRLLEDLENLRNPSTF